MNLKNILLSEKQPGPQEYMCYDATTPFVRPLSIVSLGLSGRSHQIRGLSRPGPGYHLMKPPSLASKSTWNP